MQVHFGIARTLLRKAEVFKAAIALLCEEELGQTFLKRNPEQEKREREQGCVLKHKCSGY